MQSNRFVVALLAALAVAGAQALPAIAAETSADAALTGVVTSAEEGAMPLSLSAREDRCRPVRNANPCGRL